MFSLIRRISYGVIPRPDRPWEDDPTSNAPQRRKKRRLSSTDRDADGGDEEQANKKRARGDSATPSVADAAVAEGDSLLRPTQDTQEVKDVTQGVEDVDLGGSDGAEPPEEHEEKEPAPESVPLPTETSGELDTPEPADDVSSSPLAAEEEEDESLSFVRTGESDVGQKGVAAAAEEDGDDVASSSNESPAAGTGTGED